MNDQNRIMRPRHVAEYLGICRATLWRTERFDPSFPRKIVFSTHRVGWRKAAIDAWIEQKEQSLAN